VSPEKLDLRDQTPLRWPEGWSRTLIERRRSQGAWKKSFVYYREAVSQELSRLGVSSASDPRTLAKSVIYPQGTMKVKAVRLCIRCKLRPRARNGEDHWCRECRREYSRDYRAALKLYAPGKRGVRESLP
jgi:hypothetical protein